VTIFHFWFPNLGVSTASNTGVRSLGYKANAVSHRIHNACTAAAHSIPDRVHGWVQLQLPTRKPTLFMSTKLVSIYMYQLVSAKKSAHNMDDL